MSARQVVGRQVESRGARALANQAGAQKRVRGMMDASKSTHGWHSRARWSAGCGGVRKQSGTTEHAVDRLSSTGGER
jgi:hypothetical protein